MRGFHIHTLTHSGYQRTIIWASVLCITIVVAAAACARATRNFQAALTDKPNVALYLLLPEEEIGWSTVLRENEEDTERDYLAETKDGPKLIKLKKGEKEWYVSVVEQLHP